MTSEKLPKTVSEVCTIAIMFPVVSDEQAVEYKRKIREVVGEVEGVRIDFRIAQIPMVSSRGLA